MKKMKTKCTKVGAVLFAAAAILSSCSNDDVVNNGDNTPVGDREAVKTSFSFAIPSPVSRATEGDVQANGQFQGMKNLRLMPFALTEGSGDYVAANSVLAGATQLTGSSIDTKSANFVQTFPDVVIPAGNIAFLFYGEANHAADYNGVLNMTPDVSVTSLSPADISFSLQNITEGTYTGGTYANATDLIAAWKTNVTDKLNSWVTGLADGADKTSAEELQTNYYKFNSASLMGLQLALQYLSTRLDELNAIAGASDVKTSVDNMATELADEAYVDFPANLPKGTYKLNNGKIEFDANGPSGSGIVTATASQAYSYPSSLYYWTNAYPVEYETTPTFDKWNNGVYGTGPGPDRRSVITSASKKIALNKTINYGVARLDVKAAIKTTDGATIPAGTISGTSTPTHVTLDNHNFVVKGLLIGGLPDALDWEMHPADDDQYTKIVYDTRVPNNGYTLTYATTPSYTGMSPLMYCLLPETADCSTGSADDLGHTPNIALEILNDGPQFYGLDGNLIPEDGTFYLVGKLTYAQDASKPEVTRVFQQDYNTTVNLTISSLAKAYNTVPDLINPRLELALAVDINWKAGLVLDVPLGD